MHDLSLRNGRLDGHCKADRRDCRNSNGEHSDYIQLKTFSDMLGKAGEALRDAHPNFCRVN